MLTQITIDDAPADQGGRTNLDKDFRLTWLRQVACDRRLVGQAPRVAVAICEHVDKTLTAAPKHEVLAAELGVTDRTVRAAIAALVARGHLEVTKRYGAPNAYRLIVGGRRG